MTTMIGEGLYTLLFFFINQIPIIIMNHCIQGLILKPSKIYTAFCSVLIRLKFWISRAGPGCSKHR